MNFSKNHKLNLLLSLNQLLKMILAFLVIKLALQKIFSLKMRIIPCLMLVINGQENHFGLIILILMQKIF